MNELPANLRAAIARQPVFAPYQRPDAASAAVAPAVAQSSPEQEKAALRDEKALQGDISSYLRLHGLEFINPPMNKRSMLPLGWPDFSVCYRGLAIGIEAKVWGRKPEPHQSLRHEAMRASGWRVIVAHSVADVQALFRQIDAEIQPRPTI